MTKIKICGLSEVEHVLAASKAGTDYIGLVFAQSRRRVSINKAWVLLEALRSQKRPATAVGVFADETIQEVNRIIEYCHLDWVQLSGSENWDYCREIECPVIKVIHVLPNSSTGKILKEIDMGYRVQSKQKLIILLDTGTAKMPGGTGQVFDWQIAKKIVAKYPVIIAGGLNSANVGQLIKDIQPWGVDVSTGVENNKQKDVSKIVDFIQTVRNSE
ncbi:MAG: phosphoribosylanthranilate isomerase [Dehalococcoidales bacterium]|nr:phosphoribosylanthranilate isomerase [Dehalococcoidales bacterium]